MPAQKVDFKYVRENADILDVLLHYGYTPDKDGTKAGQYKTLCPFHDDHKPSLKVNADKNIYHCFVCDAGGNVLELTRDLEGYGEKELRKAAIKLAEICGIATAPGGDAVKPSSSAKSVSKKKPAKQVPSSSEPDTVSAQDFYGVDEEDGDGVPYNKPLAFELKNLVTEHPFFDERGITPEEIMRFGLGIAQKGMMKGRLAIPIHNPKGDLVAYCGRWVEAERPDDEPKYLLPPGFRKDLELYNLNRIAYPQDEVVLVESYLSVWRLGSSSVPTLSCMGRSISQRQIELIKEGVKRVVIMFDGDEPGRTGATEVAAAIARAGMWTRIIDLPEGVKPHHLRGEEVIERRLPRM